MKFTINSVDVTPENYGEIELILDNTDFDESISISTKSMSFVNEGRDEILKHLALYGRTQGLPLQITLKTGQVLDYYIDCTTLVFQDDAIEGDVFKRYENRSFWGQADSTTFDLMRSKGVNFTLTQHPYIVKPINYELEIAVVGVGVTQLILELRQVIIELGNLVALLANPTNAVATVIMIALLVTKFVLIVLALINMIERLRLLVFPELKYFTVSNIKDLVVKGCDYLGFSVSSSLLNNLDKLHYLGVPLNQTDRSVMDILLPSFNGAFTRGYPTFSDYQGGVDHTTLGGFLRWFTSKTNSRLRVRNNTVTIERRDKLVGTAPVVNPALTLQNIRVDEFTANTVDMWSNALVIYPTDASDYYTSDNASDTITEYQTQQINTLQGGHDIINIRNINRVDMEFCLAKRKETLTSVEEFTSKLAAGASKLLDLVTFDSASNTNTSKNNLKENLSLLANPETRIGVSLISDQFFKVPKLLWLDSNGKQPKDYKNFIGADIWYKKFWNIDFIGNNDFLIKSGECVMNGSTFVTLSQSDFAEVNGEVVEVQSCQYNDINNTAKILWKERNNWAFNLKQVKLS